MPTIPPTTAPTEDDIYASSRLKWRKLGITSAADLAEPLMEALGYLVTITGRYYSDYPPPGSFSDSMSLVGTPELVPLMRQATRMRVEQIVEQKQPGYIGTVTDDAISSMSVGGYSESRRDPTRRGEEKTLNLWTGLNDLLWALMTDERYAYWYAFVSGKVAPAFAVEEVDWALIGKNVFWPDSGALDASVPWMMFG